MAQQKGTQNQKKDDNTKKGQQTPKAQPKPGANITLQAIAAIKKEDHFSSNMPKVEEWLKELSGFEKQLVFKNLERIISVDEAITIIKQIISKDDGERREQTELLGLLQMDAENELFQTVMLDNEISNPQETEKIENWLLTLSPKDADYFRMVISKMEKNNINRTLAWLSKMNDDDTRTKRARARGLITRQ